MRASTCTLLVGSATCAAREVAQESTPLRANGTKGADGKDHQVGVRWKGVVLRHGVLLSAEVLGKAGGISVGHLDVGGAAGVKGPHLHIGP